MKFICSRDNLAEGINIVQKAVSAKSTLPVLEGILVECGENLKLMGNDLEIGIECYVESDIIEKGSIVINSRIFGEIVRRLPDSEVSFEVEEDNNIIIDCENSHFEIKGLGTDGFPSIPEIEKDIKVTLMQKTVKDMIRQTIFAVSPDTNRPILTGTLFESYDNQITFVSCDSYRVALRKKSNDGENLEASIVIPGKTLNEIGKILHPVEEKMNIYISNNQIMFDMDNCRVVSRLLQGEYFKYRSFIPEEFSTRVIVDRANMLASIERASLLISTEEKRYPLNVNVKNDKILIHTSTNLGNVNESLRVDMEGKELEIKFNPRYFAEALRVIEDEKIEVCFTSDISPCIIKPIDGDEYIYLVVPLRK